jgi:hypothetical protein
MTGKVPWVQKSGVQPLPEQDAGVGAVQRVDV